MIVQSPKVATMFFSIVGAGRAVAEVSRGLVPR